MEVDYEKKGNRSIIGNYGFIPAVFRIRVYACLCRRRARKFRDESGELERYQRRIYDDFVRRKRHENDGNGYGYGIFQKSFRKFNDEVRVCGKYAANDLGKHVCGIQILR